MKLLKWIRPETLIDIGANIGEFSVAIASAIPSCSIIMVEANPYCQYHLQKTNLPYDIVALSNTRSKKDFFVTKDNKLSTGASFYKENTIFYSNDNLEVLTLDTYELDTMGYFADDPIDLIKLDVQGSELDIIEGVLKTLSRTKFLLCELSLLEYNIGSPKMETVVERISKLNFGIADIIEYHYLSNGSVFQLDILFKNLS